MSEPRQVRLRDRVVYVAARVAIGTAARVPQWLGYRAAALLGKLWFRVDGRRRRFALRFLQQAYPELSEREQLRLGSQATASLFMVPLDMARLTRLLDRGGDLAQVCDFTGVQRQLDKVRPPFFGLTAHLGSWEVAAAGIAQLCGKAHGIARITKNPLLNRWLLGTRERGGLKIHPRRGGFRDLANAMADGGVGLQVVDQNQRLRGVFAPFFGKTASCERAAVSLALRRGYPIVVGAALRRGVGFRFDVIAEEPFVPESTGDKEADLLRAVGQVNERLERLIRRAPEQYLWIHDRYR
ncbi:MAG: lysophospholipid acyltransferase family protein, partial [Planctomycetes bacterium]|nr:lysophospholipid acyltransferase family protein [Planctomycetota bacterium]